MAGYQAPQDEPGLGFRSRSCVTGAHEDCGHLFFPALGLRTGGRPPLVLCRCGCHLGCTLAGRLGVSHSTWVGLCDCPGTELAEDRMDEAARQAPDFPDMERLLRERQEKRAHERQQQKVAREATRAAAAGKSRAQIRESYEAELRARGLTVPSALVLDATADAIARNREISPPEIVSKRSASDSNCAVRGVGAYLIAQSSPCPIGVQGGAYRTRPAGTAAGRRPRAAGDRLW